MMSIEWQHRQSIATHAMPSLLKIKARRSTVVVYCATALPSIATHAIPSLLKITARRSTVVYCATALPSIATHAIPSVLKIKARQSTVVYCATAMPSTVDCDRSRSNERMHNRWQIVINRNDRMVIITIR